MRFTACTLRLAQIVLTLTLVVPYGTVTGAPMSVDAETSGGAHIASLTRRRPLYWLKVAKILSDAKNKTPKDTAKELVVVTAKNQAKWAAIYAGAHEIVEREDDHESEKAEKTGAEAPELTKNDP